MKLKIDLKRFAEMSNKTNQFNANYKRINLKNLRKIVSTGVDRISVGELTHTVNAIDFKLEL